MTRVITIRLEVPDDVEVRWDDARADGEPLPLPGWSAPAPLRREPPRLPARSAPTSASGVCPVHRTAWRTVPAGVSKKTGRPYAAFRVCPESGCDVRPRDDQRRTAV